VIGNADYENFENLPNVSTDAKDVGAKLKTFGFDVDYVVNGNMPKLLESMEKLAEKGLTDGLCDIIFYYAGHGCSVRKWPFLAVMCTEVL
jgi:uncharacterized caspase-like protein